MGHVRRSNGKKAETATAVVTHAANRNTALLKGTLITSQSKGCKQMGGNNHARVVVRRGSCGFLLVAWTMFAQFRGTRRGYKTGPCGVGEHAAQTDSARLWNSLRALMGAMFFF